MTYLQERKTTRQVVEEAIRKSKEDGLVEAAIRFAKERRIKEAAIPRRRSW